MAARVAVNEGGIAVTPYDLAAIVYPSAPSAEGARERDINGGGEDPPVELKAMLADGAGGGVVASHDHAQAAGERV